MPFAGFIEQLTPVSSGARIFSYFRLSFHGERTQLPALVLLHGYPQNSLMWKAFVEEIPKEYSVFVPDLPGYGKSIKPASADSLAHSKRQWAVDIIQALDAVVGLVVGFATDPVKIIPYGHDRGAQLAYRLALDFPHRVAGAAILNSLPTSFVWHHIKLDNNIHHETRSSWHWVFLSSPRPFPETLIAADPKSFFYTIFQHWIGAGPGANIADDWISDAIKQYTDPENGKGRIIGSCEDHRAGATHDVAHDLHAGVDPANPSRVFNVPLLVLSSIHLHRRFPVHDIWESLASGGLVTSYQIGDQETGHFLVNVAQNEVAQRTRQWLQTNWPNRV